MQLVNGIPVVLAQHHGSRGSTDCPLDSLDSHVHLEFDYSDGTIDIVAYGPGVPRIRTQGGWAWRVVHAKPSRIARLMGWTLERELDAMTETLVDRRHEAVEHAASLDAIRDDYYTPDA